MEKLIESERLKCQCFEKEKEDLIKTYLGNNEYHLEHLEKSRSGKFSINLGAYILGPFWLLLKGMNLYGIAMTLVMSCFLYFFRSSKVMLLGYVFNITLFLWGNKLYYHFIHNKVEKIIQLHSDQEIRIQAVRKQIKVSSLIGLCVSIIFVIDIIWLYNKM